MVYGYRGHLPGQMACGSIQFREGMQVTDKDVETYSKTLPLNNKYILFYFFLSFIFFEIEGLE